MKTIVTGLALIIGITAQLKISSILKKWIKADYHGGYSADHR